MDSKQSDLSFVLNLIEKKAAKYKALEPEESKSIQETSKAKTTLEHKTRTPKTVEEPTCQVKEMSLFQRFETVTSVPINDALPGRHQGLASTLATSSYDIASASKVDKDAGWTEGPEYIIPSQFNKIANTNASLFTSYIVQSPTKIVHDHEDTFDIYNDLPPTDINSDRSYFEMDKDHSDNNQIGFDTKQDESGKISFKNIHLSKPASEAIQSASDFKQSTDFSEPPLARSGVNKRPVTAVARQSSEQQITEPSLDLFEEVLIKKKETLVSLS